MWQYKMVVLGNLTFDSCSDFEEHMVVPMQTKNSTYMIFNILLYFLDYPLITMHSQSTNFRVPSKVKFMHYLSLYMLHVV